MRAGIKCAVTLCIAIVMVLSLFAGCGTAAEKPAADTTKAADEATAVQETAAQATATQETTAAAPAKIKVLTVNNWWFKGTDAFAEEAAKQTGVSIELETLPDEQGVQVIKTRLATGDVPDILVYYTGANMKQLDPEKQFMDLSNEPWKDNMVDAAKSVVTVNDKIYGSPNNCMPMGGVVYNKKIYASLGLSVPVTWQQFLDNCEKIKAAGIVPVAYTFKDNWTAQLIPLIGWYECQAKNPGAADLINTNKLKVADIPQYVGNLKKLYELKEKGYINKDYSAATFDNGQKMIANGEAAMYFMGSWIVDTLSANYPDKVADLGGFGLPSDDGSATGVCTWAPQAFYIPLRAKNPDAAKKWIGFWSTPEGQKVFLSGTKPNGAPSFKNVDVSDTYDIVKDFKKYVDAGKAAIALEFQIDISVSNDFPMICVSAATGQKTPEQAAKAVDDVLAKNAKDMKLAGW